MLCIATLAALAAAASPAAGHAKTNARVYWSESYAEHVLKSKLRMPCADVRKAKECSVAAALKELARSDKAAADCNALPTPDMRIACLQTIGSQGRDPDANLDHVRHGFPLTSADCVGGGGDRSGYRFAQFRCKVKVVDENVFGDVIDVSGRVLIKPTGRMTFRWSLI